MLRIWMAALAAVAWVALVPSGTALAQHADVEFGYDGGQIEIEPGDEGLIFEGEFPTSGLFERFTINPGFASETDEGLGIGPGDIVSYNVLDNLFFWSAVTSDFADPGATTITIGNAIGPDTIVGGATGVIAPGGVIGQAGGDGDFHAHLDFTLSAGAASGAYGLLLELDTDATSIANSDPFFIVFNFGLSESVFEDQAIPAFAAIPEPSSVVLGAIGSVLVGVSAWRRRRRRSP